MFISIVGTISSGKSTLVGEFAKKLSFVPFMEPVKENPFLSKFYEDPKRYSLTMQMFMLHYRYKQHLQQVHSQYDTISDSSIYSDYCFADMLHDDGLMDDDEYGLYVSALENMKKNLMYPDVIIYIDCPPENAHARLKQRARDCEVGVPLEYLQKLDVQYKKMIERISKHVPVIVIPEFTNYDTMEKEIIVLYDKCKKIVETHTKWDKVLYDWKL